MLPPTELIKERHAKDAVLFREGEPGNAAYVVHSGAIGIFKTVGGQRLHLATLKDGELFGELAIIDGSPRMADAVALVDSVVIKVPRAVLEAKLARHDVFLQTLMRILVTNLRNVHRAYMRRPRSIQDHLAVLATAANGLHRYLSQLESLDPDAEALKKVASIEHLIGELRVMFEGHQDRRRNVFTDTDL